MKNTLKASSMIAVIYLFTGYQELSAQAKKDSVKEKQIEEVVMVGYTSQKRGDLTSAVASVKSSEIQKQPATTAMQSLQGKLSGVTIVNTDQPGATPSVIVRGLGTALGGRDPLYVVDGIQTRDISGINPDDIVDMTILKDATSTAIYGINGSAGVVIVTTKRGKANKPQLNFNAYVGVSNKVDNVDVLNLEQYKDLISEINPAWLNTINDPMYAGINTDWVKKV